VDDITVTVHLTLHSLYRAGFDDVDTAINGRIAVTMAKQRTYDIILMDITLPVLSGIEATKKIREYEKKINREPAYIIALTGAVSEDDLELYKEAGMNGCIEKGCVVSRAMHYLTAHRTKCEKDFLFINPTTSLIVEVPVSRRTSMSHFRNCQSKHEQEDSTLSPEASTQLSDSETSLLSSTTSTVSPFLHRPTEIIA